MIVFGKYGLSGTFLIDNKWLLLILQDSGQMQCICDFNIET